MISGSDDGCYLVSEIFRTYSRWLTAKLVVSIESFHNFGSGDDFAEESQR